MERVNRIPGSAMRRRVAFALLLGLACIIAHRAEGVEGEKKQRPVEFRADQMTGKEDVWTLTKNVAFMEKNKDMILKADQAVYWAKEDRAEITGNIVITDPENSGTADVVKADFAKKIIYFEGNVKVERTPKEAKQTNEDKDHKFTVEEAKKKSSTITSDRMEYDYDKHLLVATASDQVPVTVVQEKRTATCKKADYDEDKNILTLTEGVRVEDKDGNWFECSHAVINTDTDEVEASDITGVYFYEEEKKPAEEQPAETPAAAPTQPPAEGTAGSASGEQAAPPPTGEEGAAPPTAPSGGG